jgi:hypothetical protein
MAHGGESPNEALTRWRSWIERISNDLVRSRGSHRSWDEARHRWRFNRSLWIKNDAIDWIRRSHAESLVLAIRRETDRDHRSISLWNLLSQLERKARYVTVEKHVALSGSEPLRRHMAQEEAKEWLEAGTNHLDPAIPAGDLHDLERETKIVRDYVNRSVAHRDGGGGNPTVTWRDLEASLMRIETIAQRYNVILRSTSFVTYESARQFDETLFFRRPWERARWKKASWPPDIVERVGEFRRTFDTLKRSEYLALCRARHKIAQRLQTAWKWDAPTDSPIRTTLEALALPSSDAAVMWVRDRLLQRDREDTT